MKHTLPFLRRTSGLSAGILTLFLGLGPAALAQTNSAAKPCMGAYVHIRDLFGKESDAAKRRQELARHLDLFKTSGLHTLMPYVNTTAGAAEYPSEVIPQRSYGDWDPLALVVTEAHQRGLEVYPVIVALACGHSQPKGILLQHPDWALRNKAGKPLGHISPCNPEARAYVVKVAKEIATRYRPDGILLDYLRFPNEPVQLDPVGQQQFDAQEKTAPAPQALQAFKEKALTQLAREISQETRSAVPGLKIALYTWGPHVTQNHLLSQDWKSWARLGYIDRVEISGYCYRDNYQEHYLEVFEKRLRDSVALAAGSPVTVAFVLGVDTSHGRIKSAAEMEKYLQIAQRTGIRGVTVFTWDVLEPFLKETSAGHYFDNFERTLTPR